MTVYTIKQMSSDNQAVANLLRERKQQYIDLVKLKMEEDDNMPTDEQWAFNHICTVLDHAAKLMVVDVEEYFDTDNLTTNE